MPAELLTPVGFIVVLLGVSVLVIVHETGHYVAARIFGMRVLRYSLGFGPVLFKHQPKGSPTTFQICAIPVLAYVQIDGMSPMDEIDPNDPALYPNTSVFARITTILAGPLANYLFASLAIFALHYGDGREVASTSGPVIVGEVVEGSAAAEAGLLPGDVITNANGHEVTSFEVLQRETAPRVDQPTVYIVERDGAALPPITITPRLPAGETTGPGVIGIARRPRYETVSASEAASDALRLPFLLTVRQLEAIGQMIARRSAAGLSGPLGIVREGTRSVQHGARRFAEFLIFMSIALGFFNLLPMPALDGGRLVFLGFELITRRRANERVEAMIHTVGLLFLLGLIAVVTIYNDVPG